MNYIRNTFILFFFYYDLLPFLQSLSCDTTGHSYSRAEGDPFTQGHSAVKKPRRFGVYEVQTSELVHCEIINLR